MRLGQNRRMRGRNRANKGPNPLTRTYESNGPDVKIRGTAQHIAEKYSQLSRDAQAAGDSIAVENYLQHAEHYFRIIAASQEQTRQQYGQYQRNADDEQDDSDAEEAGNNAGFEANENASFDESEFSFQPAPYERQQEERREQRPQRMERRSRYGRMDRSANHDQQRFEPDNDSSENGASSAPPRRERFPRQNQQSERTGRTRHARMPVETSEDIASTALPAFLTNPVRQPTAAKVGGLETGPSESVAEDVPQKPVRRRRRTVPVDNGSPAEVVDI